MNEILAATQARLKKRQAELVALLADGETRCNRIAEAGNDRITEIKSQAEAQIDAIRAELATHAEELAGVRHSTATLEQLSTAREGNELAAEQPQEATADQLQKVTS